MQCQYRKEEVHIIDDTNLGHDEINDWNESYYTRPYLTMLHYRESHSSRKAVIYTRHCHSTFSNYVYKLDKWKVVC